MSLWIDEVRCNQLMEITFKNKKLQKNFNTSKELIKAYGTNRARKIKARLDDLLNAPNLETMKHLPGRCHELQGDKKGQLSLDVEHPYRLLFEPSNEDIQRKPDGGLDWNSVTAVIIVSVEDTHD